MFAEKPRLYFCKNDSGNVILYTVHIVKGSGLLTGRFIQGYSIAL